MVRGTHVNGLSRKESDVKPALVLKISPGSVVSALPLKSISLQTRTASRARPPAGRRHAQGRARAQGVRERCVRLENLPRQRGQRVVVQVYLPADTRGVTRTFPRRAQARKGQGAGAGRT